MDDFGDFTGKCAVVTGGGGLLGAGMATAFARKGMNVVVSDLNADTAAATAAAVEALGAKALAVTTDVADPDSVERLAEQSYAAFGAVHVLCNNAGLAVLKPFVELTRTDWNRVLSVQFDGVLNGILTFMPRMIAQGGRSHIVNTSSMSGVGRADLRQLNAPYVTAKFAVVGLSETMAPSLAEHGIGVSVLCPGMTVADPANFTTFKMPSAQWYEHNLLDADQVAQEVLHGIEENRLHIFPHRAGRGEVQTRHQQLLDDFDKAERTSPPLG